MLQAVPGVQPFLFSSTQHKSTSCRDHRPLRQPTTVSLVRDTAPSPKVKICGITTVKDAKLAATAGADMLGMIMWQKAKRAVSESVARDIASVAADYGIQSVGVFVDESAQQIQDACGQCGIHVAQLHGPEARKALFQLPENLHVSFVMNCNAQGRIQTPTPAILAEQTEQVLHRHVQWLLIDGQQGGSGQALPWSKIHVPAHVADRGWLLAGGLHPDNVAEAVSILHPTVVDVSSGVTQGDGVTKDKDRVAAFIKAVKHSNQLLLPSEGLAC